MKKFISTIENMRYGIFKRYLFGFCFLLILLTGCTDDDTLDERLPTIDVEGIEMNEIKETPSTEEGFILKMIIADNAGLLKYKIEVDSASAEVFTFENSDLQYKLEHADISLENLSTNYLYDVKIIVDDINSNSSIFEFKLRINDFQKYDYLGLVGDATTAGWNPGASAEMVQDPSDPAIFTYEGSLKSTGEGALKIATFLGDWCDGEWLYAPQPNQNIEASAGFVINGCGGPDDKWQVTEETEGNYLITVNLRAKTIDFQKQD
ncbi:SusF/SusE family outer membrane protein [Flavimarina sp. Hel_I_48]|uniref:SusF/SusE family outer membrane protein n=1 Tax=Flavimarina sp. Hel_I_48 TaxID=1392488 RepID=UPI0004DF9819|nr:SusF/SusE family outer membrane protein [Flavimarina sp. Hel_I_48]